jgi:hypothetical protein
MARGAGSNEARGFAEARGEPDTDRNKGNGFVEVRGELDRT